MSIFGDRRRGRDNNKQDNTDDYEFYEDIYPNNGYNPQPIYPSSDMRSPSKQNYMPAYQTPTNPTPGSQIYSNIDSIPRNYQNVVVYKPTTPDDVQTLIDFLKRREPAIVNLDDAEPTSAQRVLDFISGATYALNGSIHRISSNIFFLSPEGVEVAVPYEDKK